ncbi:hypothetical protein TYRP_001609 [Tyrophagus putrescentiae]|nr:hypothetical protein TYRP_001609 [Tyrophagus putrescentiae]
MDLSKPSTSKCKHHQQQQQPKPPDKKPAAAASNNNNSRLCLHPTTSQKVKHPLEALPKASKTPTNISTTIQPSTSFPTTTTTTTRAIKRGPVKLDLSCLERFISTHKLILTEVGGKLNSLLFEILHEVAGVAGVAGEEEGEGEGEDGDASEGDEEEEEEENERENSKEEKVDVEQSKKEKLEKEKISRRLAEEARPLVEELQSRMRQAKETFFEEVGLECLKVGRERKGVVLLNPPAVLPTEVSREHPLTSAWYRSRRSLKKGTTTPTTITSEAVAASLLQRMTVDAEDVERVIAACSTVPLAELDAHLEVFLSKRPFYVPSIGEGAEEAEEVEVDIKALRRLIEAKAEANGAQEGEWTRQDVDELDDAALLSKVLLVNARVRRAKAMIVETRRLQEVATSTSEAPEDRQRSEEAKQKMAQLAKSMTAEFCQQHAPLIAEIEATINWEAREAEIQALMEEKLALERENERMRAEKKAELGALIAREEELQAREEAELLERQTAAVKKKEAGLRRAQAEMKLVKAAMVESTEQLKAKQEQLRQAKLEFSKKKAEEEKEQKKKVVGLGRKKVPKEKTLQEKTKILEEAVEKVTEEKEKMKKQEENQPGPSKKSGSKSSRKKK